MKRRPYRKYMMRGMGMVGCVLVLLLAGCQAAATPAPVQAPTVTALPPTPTALPPTLTEAPATPTTAPPTRTEEPAPPTAQPPTATAAPPTPTAAPPTATPAPPTAEPSVTAQPAAPAEPSAASPAPPGPPPPAPLTGEVVYMAGPREPGGSSLMKRIWNWQLEHGYVPACPECVDAVALVEPQYKGQKVWLQHPNGEIVGPLLVVDSAAEEHRANLRARGRLGDVSWELAQQWGMTGPLDGVTLYFAPP